MSNYLYHNRVW